MTLVLLTLLTISTSTSPIKAPGLPSWPGDLPPAQRQDEGTFLPKPLDKEVLHRLVYLDKYPMLCQNALDGLDSLRQAQLGEVDEANFWVDWSWKITGVLGFLTGAIVGYKLSGH
jgi:hypothetical protein